MRLIVTEKDNAAKRIASILSGGKAKSEKVYGIPVYVFQDTDEVRVIGLKGHILKVDFPPQYNDWQKVDPLDLVKAEIVKIPTQKTILKALQKEAKEANQVTIATDFDSEGELIGVDAINKIREVNPDIRVKRARFSALTEGEIKQAFSHLEEPYLNLARAGAARQDIDLIWGAALTRVISLASSRLGKQFLSVGRVQTPTLVLLSEKEKERQVFIAKSYWQIIGTFERDGQAFEASHKIERFWEKEKAEAAISRLNKESKVTKVAKELRELAQPSPFNTTTLLAAASSLGFSAANAMRVAEDLYMSGYISYPRSDNTYYPDSLNIREVLDTINKSEKFAFLTREILKQRKIVPSHGKRRATDHPPIYPTGVAKRSELDERSWKIYELVVRRFLATCAPEARIESMRVDIDVNGEPFFAKGERIVDEGWLKFYPYPRKKELILPDLKEGEKLKLLKHELLEKQTQPPPRFRQGSLIQEMEKLGLGTKSTRHNIIQNLYDRGYIYGDPIVPTKMGMAVAEALKRHAATISTPEMTAELERDMEAIVEGKEANIVVDKSRGILHHTVKGMQRKKEELAREIWQGIESDRVLGRCPVCDTGELRLIRSKKSGKRFIGCSNYPDCKTAYPLPQYGMIQPAGESCSFCGTPRVKVISKGKKPWIICPNPDCPSKQEEKEG